MSTVGDMLAKIQQNKTDVKPIRPIVEAPIQAIDDWGISKRTCTLYGYRSTDKNHYADFKDKDGQTVAQHVRRLEPKGFSWVGERPKPMQLFGQNLGNQGNLIITEGEKDCLCVRELLTVRESQTWVVVSIPDGVTSAVQSIKPHLSWVLGFESVRILFDTDKPGVTNAQKVAELIGPKARIVTGLGEYKDAADAWLAGDKATLKLAIMQAKKHRPDGVVAAVDLMEQVLHPKIHRGHDFPWKGWNDCTEGLKPGEVHMIAGGTGIGKSLFSRSIGLRLCMTGVRVAYLGFEESTSCTYERMISECMGQAMYRRPEEWRVEHQQEIRDAAKTFAQNLFLIDKFGSIDFDVFFANVRHYVLSEQCSVVILDHFSIIADGIDLRTDQRRAIDQAIKKLKELAMELNFTFIVVCHIARNNSGSTPAEEGGEPHIGLLKGSSSLGQIPDYIWMLQRNPNDKEKNNLTHCWLKKNRIKGEVGMKCMLEYNINTCQFTETREGVGAI